MRNRLGLGPRASALSVAIVVLALTAASCGSSTKETAGTTEAPTAGEISTQEATTDTEPVAEPDVSTQEAAADTEPAAEPDVSTQEAAADTEPAAEPVVVGVISSYTGPFGIYGAPMELAMSLRLNAAGAAAGNIPVETVFEDDGTDPATAVQKATKLIEEDGASIVVCCVNAGSTFAVAPILAEMGIPQIVPIANPLGLHENPNGFVAAPSVNWDAERLGTYAAETLGYSTAVVMGMDMAYGQAIANSFTAGFTGAGGEIVDQILTPFGTQDFGSFFVGVPDADMVFGGYAGADAIAFINQYEQFGLKDRAPLLGHGPLITELLLQIEGPAAIGTTVGFYYTSSLDNPENQAFKDALAAANPDLPPSHFTAGSWATGSILLQAIENAGAGADGPALRDAIAAVEVDTPWGPAHFDADSGYIFGPTYIYTAVQDGEALRHEPLAIIN
ncbi:MAG: hypothetical protein CL466_09245 [Acidimicrobiaceae bacterium]|nr:hypothetical protein [Acidimicrobiaceae bacterium]